MPLLAGPQPQLQQQLGGPPQPQLGGPPGSDDHSEAGRIQKALNDLAKIHNPTLEQQIAVAAHYGLYNRFREYKKSEKSRRQPIFQM